MIKFRVREDSEQAVGAALRKLRSALADRRDLVELIEEDFYDTERTWFNSKGKSTWKPLSPAYSRQKTRMGFGSKILVVSGELMGALTRVGGRYQIRTLTKTGAKLAITHPAASYHDKGTKNMPLRRLVDPIVTDPRRFDDLVDVWIVDTLKRTGFK